MHHYLNRIAGVRAEGRSLSRKSSPRIADNLRRMSSSYQRAVHVAQERFHPSDAHTNTVRIANKNPTFFSDSAPQVNRPNIPQTSFIPPPVKSNLSPDSYMPQSVKPKPPSNSYIPQPKPSLSSDSYMPQPPPSENGEDDSDKPPTDYNAYDDYGQNGQDASNPQNGSPPKPTNYEMSSDLHSPPQKGNHQHQSSDDYMYLDYDHDHVKYKDHMESMHDEERNKKPYSYYYIGRKLWYIPLYFSVYFIVYVTALLLKAIARHKIIYPIIHWAKEKRSIDSTAETITRYLEKAIELYSDKA